MGQPKPKRRPRQTVPQDAEPLKARPSYRCSTSEFEAACKAAARRGMTFSQLVRLAVNNEVKRVDK
jgi:hypothetical protein